MTTALCTACGSLKFGAWLPCEECGVAGAVPPDVATFFTDHFWTEETLLALGRVVRHINSQHRSPKIRALAFLQFAADAYPEALEFNPGLITGWRVRRFLRTAALPPVEWVESAAFQRRKQHAES